MVVFAFLNIFNFLIFLIFVILSLGDVHSWVWTQAPIPPICLKPNFFFLLIKEKCGHSSAQIMFTHQLSRLAKTRGIRDNINKEVE